MSLTSPINSMRLGSLLAGYAESGLSDALEIHGLAIDSREVKTGMLFFAYRGIKSHGIEYVEKAIDNGAVAVVYDISRHNEAHQDIVEHYSRKVPMIRINDLQKVIGEIASRFYGNPSKHMKVIAVTGTDGKTSVTQFIAQVLEDQYRCGVIGTLGSGVVGNLEEIKGRTTPDAITMQRHLHKMYHKGVEVVIVEASSHGLDQDRLAGTVIDVAVFTNISHEHLDYHGSIKRYAECKHKLFKWPKLKAAVLNVDDEFGRSWIETIPKGCKLIGYSTSGDNHSSISADLRCDDLVISNSGLDFDVHSSYGVAHVSSSLIGRFNVSNLLACLGAVIALGVDFNHAVKRLSEVKTVAGRMEQVKVNANQPMVVVDYAHTPDALAHVLKALREHCSGHLWVVFGCGGDRDQTKRPLMGRNAEALADVVIITNDNPRSEDPITILEQITSGMDDPDSAYVILDRSRAIARAIDVASKNDVVLIAGKGHESEQCIGNVCLPFNDVVKAREYLQQEVVNG